MTAGLNVLLANVPTLICAGIGGLLVDRGHPWAGAALLVLAFLMSHSVKGKDDE